MSLLAESAQLFRLHRARPSYALTVIAILGVAIGVNTAVFSVFDAVLLRPLPYTRAEQLVRVFDTNAASGVDRNGPSPGNFLDWQRRTSSFSAMAAWYAGKPRTLEGTGDPIKVPVADVTSAFFDVLDGVPLLGRPFRDGDTTPDGPVAVMSHQLWLERYGGDSAVVGRGVLLNGETHTVIAVMRADFAVPAGVGFWIPWDLRASYAQLPEVPRDYRFLEVAARLRPGIDMQQGALEMDRLARVMAVEHPAKNQGWGVRLTAFEDEVVGRFGGAIRALLLAVALVLLLACSNVANVALARQLSRTHEFALRAALGAGGARLQRLVLLESVLLALAGGIVGVLLAVIGVRLLVTWAPAGIPRIEEVSLNSSVLLFSLVAAVLSGMITGLAPALRLGAMRIGDVLRGGTRAGGGRVQSRARQALVAAQITLAFSLVAGAGLMTRSLLRILGTDAGFDPAHILVARVFPDETRFSGEERLQYFEQLYASLGSLPGVVAVGATTGLPLNRFNNAPIRPYWAADAGPPAGGGPTAPLMMTSRGYFNAMRIPLLAGRDFSPDDRAGAPPVVIVNQTLARQVWGSQDAAGKRLMIDFATRGTTAYEVIGVVGDVRASGPGVAPEPGIYVPHAQVPYAQLNVVVRTVGDPLAIESLVRRAVLSIDARQPAHSITTMERLLGESIAQQRFGAFMAAALALLALVLAVAGVYAVAARIVAERTREIGVRSALGAGRREILRLVIAQFTSMLGAGALGSIVGVLLIAAGLRGLLFEVGALDPVALGGAAGVIVAAVAAGVVVPLQRALRVSPVESLRRD